MFFKVGKLFAITVTIVVFRDCLVLLFFVTVISGISSAKTINICQHFYFRRGNGVNMGRGHTWFGFVISKLLFFLISLFS
jgi:hypothetical protein